MVFVNTILFISMVVPIWKRAHFWLIFMVGNWFIYEPKEHWHWEKRSKKRNIFLCGAFSDQSKWRYLASPQARTSNNLSRIWSALTSFSNHLVSFRSSPLRTLDEFPLFIDRPILVEMETAPNWPNRPLNRPDFWMHSSCCFNMGVSWRSSCLETFGVLSAAVVIWAVLFDCWLWLIPVKANSDSWNGRPTAATKARKVAKFAGRGGLCGRHGT